MRSLNSNVTFIGNLLKNDIFLDWFGRSLASNGGVKVGEPVAYFVIDGDRYIYKTYTISLPAMMISNNENIVDVFFGLIVRDFPVSGGLNYVSLRTVEATEKDGMVNFYIRAVQV